MFPDNTIICFLGSLNYLAYVDTFNYSINLPDFDFITALQDMSVNQYLDFLNIENMWVINMIL